MLNNIDKRFSDIEKRIDKMQKREKEFAQRRSNFQLEKFVADDEYSNITKFRLVSHNSYVAMQEIRKLIIDKTRLEREIKFKQKTFKKYQCNNFPIDLYREGDIVSDYDLDICELTRQIEDIEIRILGLSKEVDYMEAICDKLEEENGKPFTNEQFQQEEPQYWQKRLMNQMHQTQVSRQLGIEAGDYRAYLQSIEEPILDSKLKIQPVPLNNINSIATVALCDRKGVSEIMLQKIETKEENEKISEV